MFPRNAGASLPPADASRPLPLDRPTALHWLERGDSKRRIIVETTIENDTNAAFSIRCDALVDKEVAYLRLRRAWRDQPGLTRLDAVDVQVRNQAIVSGEIRVPVLLRIERLRPVLTDVLFIDMDPTHGPYEPLIGYIPLEQAQAVVDLVGHRLVRVSMVDLKCSGLLPTLGITPQSRPLGQRPENRPPSAPLEGSSAPLLAIVRLRMYH